MKRHLLILIALLAVAVGTQAQTGLHVAQVFERYGHAQGCKMVEMHQAEVRGYQLQTYKSLTYKTLGEQVDQLLEADRRQAKKIREVVEDGRILSGYYQMQPLADGTARYILFSRQTAQRGAVVYIEGRLTPDDILKLCYAKKR